MSAAPVRPTGAAATPSAIAAYDSALYQYNQGATPPPSPTNVPLGAGSSFIQGATNTTAVGGVQLLNSTQLATMPTAQALATAIGGTVVAQTQPGNSVPTYQISYGGQLYNAGLLQQMVQRYGSLSAAIYQLNVANPTVNAPLAASPAAAPLPTSVSSTGSQGNHAANPTAPPPGSGGSTQQIPQSAGQMTAPSGSVPVQTTPGTVPVVMQNATPMQVAGNIVLNPGNSGVSSSATSNIIPSQGSALASSANAGQLVSGGSGALFNVGGINVSMTMAVVAAAILILLVIVHEKVA